MALHTESFNINENYTIFFRQRTLNKYLKDNEKRNYNLHFLGISIISLQVSANPNCF